MVTPADLQLGEKLRGPFAKFKNALTHAAMKDAELGMLDEPSLIQIKRCRDNWSKAEDAETEFVHALKMALIEAAAAGADVVLKKLEASS